MRLGATDGDQIENIKAKFREISNKGNDYVTVDDLLAKGMLEISSDVSKVHYLILRYYEY